MRSPLRAKAAAPVPPPSGWAALTQPAAPSRSHLSHRPERNAPLARCHRCLARTPPLLHADCDSPPMPMHVRVRPNPESGLSFDDTFQRLSTKPEKQWSAIKAVEVKLS